MSDARAATDGLREALSAMIGGGYLDGSLTADDILRAIEAAGWQVVPKERPLPRHLPRDAGSVAPAVTTPCTSPPPWKPPRGRDPMLTEGDVLRLLARECRRAGTQADWAKAQGISPAYVSDVLKGRRAPGRSILAALGFERVVAYRRQPVSNPYTLPPSC